MTSREDENTLGGQMGCRAKGLGAKKQEKEKNRRIEKKKKGSRGKQNASRIVDSLRRLRSTTMCVFVLRSSLFPTLTTIFSLCTLPHNE